MREIIDQLRGIIADKLVSLALTVAPTAEGKELAEAVAPMYLRRVARALGKASEQMRREFAADADAKGARFRVYPLDGG